MKTAVSIRDNIFQKAENFAKKAKISRSQLYSDAVEEYLAKRNEEDLIARINAVCDEVDTSLDPVIRNYQSRVIRREKW
ncbi:MAG: ChpI protein [Acidobacteriota bacterium]|nr:ChpI protein [Acidobacteriota bacterium]